MNRTKLRTRAQGGAVALWVATLLALTTAPAQAKSTAPFAAITGYPNAMASTGDSITRAFNTGSTPFTDAPANSWSTGTNSAVNSHYSRILAANPAINGHSFNDAVTGAKMTDLNGQVTNAVGQGVGYSTILLGANDACTATEAAMTPVATYRAQFQTALDTLAAGLPDARIYVLSVPNIYNLWAVLKDNAGARAAWSTFSICQSMLVNPTSTAQADVDRRARVLQRVVDYNTQLAQVCATSIHCRFDNNATFNTTFAAADISTRDYFHPAISGQALLAQTSYAAGYDFSDSVAPVSTATLLPTPSSASMSVQLSATDNVAVAGIEYKVGQQPYSRYTAPLTFAVGTNLTYRAVDVNGNSEAPHSLAVR
ncbi:MAG: GDSL-type esterase/lipase family protein [Chloroflexota bacterium]|nr:GDSL-type esterase/lipase family protein [Chloroflexota bacterium]